MRDILRLYPASDVKVLAEISRTTDAKNYPLYSVDISIRVSFFSLKKIKILHESQVTTRGDSTGVTGVISNIFS